MNLPHLFTARHRTHNIGQLFIKEIASEWEILVSKVYLFASVLFVCGSVLFLPSMEKFGTLGAKIFVTGVFITFIINIHDVYESMHHYFIDKKKSYWSILESISAVIYFSGTLFYLFGNYYFICFTNKAYQAGMMFMIGSILFVVAAIINVMQVTREETIHFLMLMNANAICSIIGGILFTLGSIPYLWGHFSEKLDAMMGWEFIIASTIYLIGAIFSSIHTKQKIKKSMN